MTRATRHFGWRWLRRAESPSTLLTRLAALRGHVDAINLADNALGQVKLAGLVFASMIKSRLGIPVVINFSCRDRNRYALKADLLGAAGAGHRRRGRAGRRQAAADPAGARRVHDVDLFGLLRMTELNRGDTGEGKPLLKTLPLFAGAVANPNRKALEREHELLARKARPAPVRDHAAGFRPGRAARFLDQAAAMGIHAVLGILPVKRESMANYLKDRIRSQRRRSTLRPIRRPQRRAGETHVDRLSLELMSAIFARGRL